MTRVNVHDGWTVRAVGGDVPAHLVDVRVPATVPGCVHLDLLAAGLIPDPYLDENEKLLAWVGRVDWRYETTLDWTGEDSQHVELVALGLDTVATVELNGTVVGSTRNMHRSYRFPVAHLLRPGANALAVTFTGALTAVDRAVGEVGTRPNEYPHQFNALRKMACDYGWDWGPEMTTAGIWRPLFLESWSGARIAAVRPLVSVEGDTGVVRVHVDTVGVDAPVRVTVGEVEAEAVDGVAELRIPNVDLWWPRGYGAQPRYDLTVRVGDDEWRGRIGFRTVTVDAEPDAAGTPFTLVVNGERVFARGFNWIPGDCFPSRVDRERYRDRLTKAADANANLIRIWGGGIYESEDFYDLCDELGLLVWQDFPFSCAAYAEEEPLRSEVEAEAREAVTRLSAHPSLVLWCGGNECLQGFQDWGWQPQLAGRTWGSWYWTELLPRVVAELDPTRPYIPGSPFSPDPAHHPNAAEHGTMHIWDVWNSLDYTEYRRHKPRFAAEFGFQGPPTWTTLTRAVHDEPMRSDSPGVLAHQKAQDGNGKLARGLAAHLPEPATFEDWHWATQLNQARAVAVGVEHFRSLTPHCMGTVVWQLNDVWPVISWSAVDGDGRCKPMWYALRRAFRDRLLTIQPRDGGLALVVVNDDPEPWRAELPVRRLDFDGTELAAETVRVDLPARSAATHQLSVAVPGDPARELLVAGARRSAFCGGEAGQWSTAGARRSAFCGGEAGQWSTAGHGTDRALWQFAEDVAAKLPEPRLAARAEAVPGGYRLTVTAEAYVRDLTVLADRVAGDAHVDDALVTLLPGERVTFTIRTAAAVAPEAFLDPLVLRCANQLLEVRA